MDTNTNTDVLAYAREKFNVDLPASAVWTEVGKLNWDRRVSHDFVRSFVNAYPNLIATHTALKEVARPLFFAIVEYGAKQPSTEYWWTDQIAAALKIWTKNGVSDMTAQQADTLTPQLLPRLEYGGQSLNKIADMIYASPMLWERMGLETLKAGGHQPGSTKKDADFGMSSLLHRYLPQETAFDQQSTYNAYAQMCGLFQKILPNLSEIVRVLMPLHNNTYAWGIATSLCTAPEDGNWADLWPALSSLALRPNDSNAWVIFFHLQKYEHTDASCAELIRGMKVSNPEMAKAWVNIWPVVNTFYTGHERFSAAVELWKTESTPLETVELSGLSLDDVVQR